MNYTIFYNVDPPKESDILKNKIKLDCYKKYKLKIVKEILKPYIFNN